MIRGGAGVALGLLAAAGGCRYARPIPVSPAVADSTSGRCMANACALDLANESGAPIEVSVLDGNGNAGFPVALPATPGSTTLTTVDAGGETDVATFKSLGSAKLGVKVRGGNRVKVGRQAVVKVTGLAVGEQVKLKFRGVKVATGKANAKGKVTLRFPVRKVVRGNVKAIGAFADRQGTTRLVVVKRR